MGKILTKVKPLAVSLAVIAMMTACSEDKAGQSKETSDLISSTSQMQQLNFERFTLENGLTVIFHIDKSDPLVNVSLTAHVGSARELPGRTGFAHLFEHLLFLESENLGKGGLDKMSARIGGSGANGGTSNDMTTYAQTVPNDALEKMIWAEADKIGYFINTVTQQVLSKEKEVVLNEKRLRVDNRPYGHTSTVISRALFPADHPYSWSVIGSMADLNAATLQDVKDFYAKWYVPNNVTLTLAGDFDPIQAKEWVKKYFEEIPRGADMPAIIKRSAVLLENKSLFHEDNFARTAALTIVWPAVEEFHADAHALDILDQLLFSGKKSPFNRILVDDLKLTSGVRSYSTQGEIAGFTGVTARAFSGGNLDDLKAGFDEAYALFEKEGVDEAALKRIKTVLETGYYSSMRSAGGKANLLTHYSMRVDDPSYGSKDLQLSLNVSAEDIMKVYHKYIKNKPYIAASFVPKGSANLALKGAVNAGIKEEKIIMGKEKKFDLSGDNAYSRTASSFDRTVEPPYGDAPMIKAPAVWKNTLKNGLEIYGITDSEMPLVEFNITIDGGLLLDDINRVGTASLMGRTWSKGTADKTTAELENAIKDLGARINVRVSGQSVVITGSSLSKNFEKTLALAEEILLRPRFDQAEFDTAKRGIIASIKQQAGDANMISNNKFNEFMYGNDHILSRDMKGTVASVESLKLDDVKAFHARQISPKLSRFHIAGDISEERAAKALKALSNWTGSSTEIPAYPLPDKNIAPKLYFYDVPGAKQSVVKVGYLALSATDPDYYGAGVMNYILGGGGFASRLTQDLREGKGYTYGIRSGFSGTKIPGSFIVGSSIRTNVTLEGLQAIKSQLELYPNTYTDADHQVTKNYTLKSQARAFEVLRSKLAMIQQISAYDKPDDYVAQNLEKLKNMSKEDVQILAKKYLPMEQMIYLVVGDAASQFERMKELGVGDPILLNPKK